MSPYDALRLCSDALTPPRNPEEQAALSAAKAALTMPITVVANISGGILQGASSNFEVDVYTLDFADVPSDDPHNVIEVDGSEAYLGQCSALVDPEFVAAVANASTLAEVDD